MEQNPTARLDGLTIIAFESRRARELAQLIRRYGGRPISAPALREVPLEENRTVVEFIAALQRGEVDFLLLLTGVGTQTLVAAAETRYSREQIRSAFQKTCLVARGPKPVAALRALDLRPGITVPEPNTWREVLRELDRATTLKSRHVAVQEYGVVNEDWITALESRGAQVTRVPVYRWTLPHDTAPLVLAIQKILHGEVDVAVFTNATQVFHLFVVAREQAIDEKLQEKMTQVVIASVGPVCSEALVRHGLAVDLEPDHPKMGHMVATLAEHAKGLLHKKRGT